MNRHFPRTITLLRKEKNLSQKQAAKDLGVSQALLSHYEKGIRECSLDFVVKAADYYHVSADFLLGRTPQREITHADCEEESPAKKNTQHTPSERLLVNTLRVIYGTLSKISNRKLTRNVSEILMLCEYRILRTLLCKKDETMFSVDREFSQGYALAITAKLFSDIGAQCDSSSPQYITALEQMKITQDTLLSDYPESASSAFHVIAHCEGVINKQK